LSKIAERAAIGQFNDYLIEKRRLTSHQSGNRKNHSTETLSLFVTDQIYRAIDEKKVTVLIDLSKAFDSICHQTLLKKLHNIGTLSPALAWFKSYL
jgi:hypothetical protein